MKTTAALALVLLLGLPTLAHAQQNDAYSEEQMWQLASAQLVETLDAPISGVRTQALRNAIIYATLYRDKIDLGGAVRALRTVYERDEVHANRKLALAALQAIGGHTTNTYLARHVSSEEADQGRIVMASVLNDFYLARTSAARASAFGTASPSMR